MSYYQYFNNCVICMGNEPTRSIIIARFFIFFIHSANLLVKGKQQAAKNIQDPIHKKQDTLVKKSSRCGKIPY